MPEPWRQYRYSGFLTDDDPLHGELFLETLELLEKKSIAVEDKTPPPPVRTTIIRAPGLVTLASGVKVIQWADTTKNPVRGFQPGHDCSGNFTSHRFQANNNCYNYGCNIATNSMAQPGRMHGISLKASDKSMIAANVLEGAKKDGLIEIAAHEEAAKLTASDLPRHAPKDKAGHFVALLISDPQMKLQWKGDFHWVRADNAQCTSWSQKNGTDQVTNFDFAGQPITDPAKATWFVNQGPIDAEHKDQAFFTPYSFTAWMFVPNQGVRII